MYRLLIPIYNRKINAKDKLAMEALLKQAKPDMVLLTFSRVLRSEAMLKEHLELFLENKAFLEKAGFQVGAWLAPTIGYGGTGCKGSTDNDADTAYMRMKLFSGRELYSYCPLDDAFTDDFINTLLALCSTGVEMVLFEDDFTISGGKSHELGCCCDLHMARYSQKLERPVTAEDMRPYLYGGAPNEIRNTWQSVVYDTLCEFASKIEKAVHAKYPKVRLGLSANSSSYNFEGVPMPELVKLIAGPHRPFLRMTGAPYWKNALSFATNVEAIRLQRSWCSSEIEAVAEGDTYPRPRCWVPASALEDYDMILRADGRSDGILKYMIDYTSSPDFEPGYVERQTRNRMHYEEIERRFGNKRAVGVRIFENMQLFQNTTVSDKMTLDRYCRNGHLPTMSQELCVDNSIPTTYEDDCCATVVFGENALHLTDEMLSNGLILDARAAILLSQKGIDVGFLSFDAACEPVGEYFRKEEEFVSASVENPGAFFRFEIAPEAEVLSEFLTGTASLATLDGDLEDYDRYPACFAYENAKGQRFLVYSFEAATVRVKKGWHRGVFRSYLRQRQLTERIEWLQKQRLPASCMGNPELYLLCKKDKDSMAVGLWNHFADEIIHPVITLDKEYRNVDFYNCNGTLEKNRVILSDPIAAYGFAFFTVS